MTGRPVGWRPICGYYEKMFDIASIIQKIAILIPPILLAVTVHEMAHGWVAYRLGDPTAKALGRLTLNPFRHLDPVGTFVFFLTQAIGWAKPVPVNPAYFKDPRRDMMWVAFAGPAANLLLASAIAMFLRGTSHYVFPLFHAFEYFGRPLFLMAYLGVQINIGLAVFNLLPIPPLDGGKILAGLLPSGAAPVLDGLERYGFILILLLVFTGVTDHIIVPLIHALDSILLGK